MRLKITPDDIHIGQPLSWDLYNEAGYCIFKKGITINSEQSRQRILDLQLFYDPFSDASLSALQDSERRQNASLTKTNNQSYSLGIQKHTTTRVHG